MTCAFCDLHVYLPDLSEHPCCTQARDRGEPSCFGCEVFKKRWRKGKTCPHVAGISGLDKSGNPIPMKACCPCPFPEVLAESKGRA